MHVRGAIRELEGATITANPVSKNPASSDFAGFVIIPWL